MSSLFVRRSAAARSSHWLLGTAALCISILTAAAACAADVGIVHATSPSEKSSLSDATSIEPRVRELEVLLKAGEKAREQSESQLKTFLLLAGGLSTLFAGLFAYVQIRGSNQERAFAERQTEKYHNLIQGIDDRNATFREATNQSVQQVTTLIGSLDALLKLARDADALRIEIEAEKKERLGRAKREEIERRVAAREMNKEALDICLSLNRENYKVGAHKARIRNLSARLETWSSPEQLSGNSKLILGLDRMVRDLFTEASESLEAAASMSKAHAQSVSGVDIDLLYPGWKAEAIPGSAKKQTNIDLFHNAMIHYNHGQHTRAVECFKEALRYAPQDVQAMGCIPEALFLSGQPGFEEVIAEFKQTEARIRELVESPSWRMKKAGHLCVLHIKWGNCYYPGGHKMYRDHANLRAAEEHYVEACGLEPSSYLARFSYAQALAQKSLRNIPADAKKHAQQEARRLFREVFDAVKVRVGEITEPKIEMTFNYVLAICAKENDVPGTDWNAYVRDIYKLGGKLPPVERGLLVDANETRRAEIRIYSPLSKRDLIYSELKSELQAFERSAPVLEVTDRIGRSAAT